jgi:F-type H+-transporting ATPase subunit b
MTTHSLRLALLATLALPALAYAAEGGSASPFAGDLGTAIWTLVIFGLVVVVLGKFAWGPILNGLQKREDFITKSLEDAKQNRDEAEARLKEYEAKLREAQEEASRLVDEGRRDAEVLRSKIEGQAREEATALLERAKREIRIATDSAVKELFSLSASLATDVAQRVIKKELSAEDHERLIADAVEELKRMQAN